MTTLTIYGVPIPDTAIESLSKAVPVLVFGIGKKMPPSVIVSGIEPIALDIIEQIANVIFPGAGTAIEIIAWLVENQVPMDQQAVNKWMDKTSNGDLS